MTIMCERMTRMWERLVWFIMRIVVCVRFMVHVSIILVVWHVVIIVMDWIVMALCEMVVLISVMCWSDGFIHIMVWFLDEVGIVMMDRLNHNSRMMGFWVDKCFLFIVNWFLKVHLSTVNWIRPIVLNRSYDINKMDFGDIPWFWVLKEFMLGFRHVVMV